jgi:general nucleoside transport system ATP-binding protein
VTATSSLVRLSGVAKAYGATRALDGVSFDIAEGEIHGLLGENGAGKTTLMNVMYGLVSPDSGTIEVSGRAAAFRAPYDAIRAGIGMVHQHFMLVPTMTVAENVLLGLRENPFWRRRDRAQGRVRDLAREFGIDVDVTRRVDTLPVGVQQRVEVLKCLARRATVLVLDEPTAVLTPQEADELATVLRGLRDAGRSVVFISHKLGEALDVCDRITVIRRGRNVSTVAAADADEATITAMMVGEGVAAVAPHRVNADGHPRALTVEDLHVADARGIPAVRGLSLTVRAGEIVGVAGVDGNGQAELMDALAGVRMPAAGAVWVDGKDLTRASPRERADAGMAIITDDRRLKGLAPGLSVAENLVSKRFRREPASRRGWLKPRAIAAAAQADRDEYDIRTADVAMPVSELSGGNQQKVVIARELSHARSLLVAMNPTRGLDVAAAAYVHQALVRARDKGRGVLLISTELDEAIKMSDRIGVMRDGFFREAPPGMRIREGLGRLMLGGRSTP